MLLGSYTVKEVKMVLGIYTGKEVKIKKFKKILACFVWKRITREKSARRNREKTSICKLKFVDMLMQYGLTY
jgi:hypothetical protein